MVVCLAGESYNIFVLCGLDLSIVAGINGHIGNALIAECVTIPANSLSKFTE